MVILGEIFGNIKLKQKTTQMKMKPFLVPKRWLETIIHEVGFPRKSLLFKFSHRCLCIQNLELIVPSTEPDSGYGGQSSQYGRDISSKNALFCQDCHYDSKMYPFAKGQNSVSPSSFYTDLDNRCIKGNVVFRIICHMASGQEDGYLARRRIP